MPRDLSPDRPVFAAARNSVRPLSLKVAAVAAGLSVCALFGQFYREVDRLPPLEPPVGVTPLGLSGAEPSPAKARTAFEWLLPAAPDDSCAVAPSQRTREIIAYVPAGDAMARDSLVRHCGDIALVLAETFEIPGPGGDLQLLSDAPIAALQDRTLPVLRLGRFMNDATVQRLLQDEEALTSLASRVALLEQPDRPGLCLDLSDRTDLPGRLVQGAIEALQKEGLRCVIGAPEARFWAEPSLVRSIDLAVVLGFRLSPAPGDPPASATWYAEARDRVTRLIPSEKLVMAFGTRGQMWNRGRFGSRSIGYREGMTLAGSANSAVVEYLPWANAVQSRYVGVQGELIEAWFPDAVSLQNQLAGSQPGSAVAIWPLGSEDPTIWPLLTGAGTAENALELPIAFEGETAVEGQGATLVAAEPARPGQRNVVMEADRQHVRSAAYDKLPTPRRLVRKDDAPFRSISLTFSALPPARSWPLLSTLLARAEIEATFAVSMGNLEQNISVAREALHMGHVIALQEGSMFQSGSAASRFTASASQLLMANQTGMRARFIDMAPAESWEDIAGRAERLLQAGYFPLVPGRLISSNEIRNGLPPAAALASETAPWQSAERIFLSVAPQDWDSILEWMPELTAHLLQNDYSLGSVRQSAGLSREDALPPSPVVQLSASKLLFKMLEHIRTGLAIFVTCLMAYSILRSLSYLALAFIRKPQDRLDPGWTPPVSVLIPAYNEEKVIVACIRSILSAPYPDVRIIVVDDGSKDRTHHVVQESFGHHPRVTLLQQPNGGKWRAANHALQYVETPFFLIADADSVFTPDTIAWLMQPFQDEAVGAVAGVVEVGNRRTLLEECQSLEYIVSQSIIRRAQEVFNGILVVPGAVGAWRLEAVRRAGMFSGQTVTEDADLTVAVHRAGYSVRFQEQARSVTEVPADIRSFMRQRLRWTFGMLQTSWKHRGAISEGRPVGYISIIDTIWLGVLAAVFAPLMDLLFLFLLAQGLWSLFTDDIAFLSMMPASIILAYTVLTLLDLLNTLAAFRFERCFDIRLILLVPLQRFGYRQLLYISTLRALAQAFTGGRVSWNKLERTGVELLLWSKSKVLPDRRAPVNALPTGAIPLSLTAAPRQMAAHSPQA